MNSILQLLKSVHNFVNLQKQNLNQFGYFLWYYFKKKITKAVISFEGKKDLLVKFLLMKRGRYNRPFLHMVAMGVLVLGIFLGPFLADTFPIFSSSASTVSRIPEPNVIDQSLTAETNVFQTEISNKPRSEIINYTVERGDTLSTIADKFNISVDTIKWENDLSDDSLSVGDTLKILPVSGIAYKVQRGDTVYTIAQKYNTNPQKIVDFPFNDFANPETFSLVAGQLLIVPDGIPPAEQPVYHPVEPTYIAQAPQSNFSGNGFNWPLQGILTQGFSWYHPGYDIAGPVGTPIAASKGGIIAEASCGWNWGYGCHVIINHGNGWSTMYAHMVSLPIVSVGESVNAGQIIGYRGNTGRSTGPHTHFEIRRNNIAVNPGAYLQ